MFHVDVTLECTRIIAREVSGVEQGQMLVDFHCTHSGAVETKLMHLVDLFRVLSVAASNSGEATIKKTSHKKAQKLLGFDPTCDNMQCSPIP